jgi:hypothetical protein
MFMSNPAFLHALFEESYTKIRDYTKQIGHVESIHSPAEGVNCIHWIVGHIVVSRCNFSMLLEVPSIWDWATCKLFIPGSTPSAEAQERIDFTILLANLEQTQNQLLAALEKATEADLALVKDNQTVGEHLMEYAAHESFHAGQLEILCRWIK